LVAHGWERIGDLGRFLLLAGLTGAIGAAGLLLEAWDNRRSGLAFIVLFSQLLWANGGMVLVLTGAQDRPGRWAIIAGVVAAASYALAARRRSALLAVFASI